MHQVYLPSMFTSFYVVLYLRYSLYIRCGYRPTAQQFLWSSFLNIYREKTSLPKLNYLRSNLLIARALCTGTKYQVDNKVQLRYVLLLDIIKKRVGLNSLQLQLPARHQVPRLVLVYCNNLRHIRFIVGYTTTVQEYY